MAGAHSCEGRRETAKGETAKQGAEHAKPVRPTALGSEQALGAGTGTTGTGTSWGRYSVAVEVEVAVAVAVAV